MKEKCKPCKQKFLGLDDFSLLMGKAKGFETSFWSKGVRAMRTLWLVGREKFGSIIKVGVAHKKERQMIRKLVKCN